MHAAELIELWMGATVHYRISVSTFCKAPGRLSWATPFPAVVIRHWYRFPIKRFAAACINQDLEGQEILESLK